MKPEHVTSPTYTYLNEYDNKVLHIDMYRISQSTDLLNKGILDRIENYDNIVIERPKFESDYSDDDRLKVEITK
ncbi:tRNA (adenosine(37)-N6)-threonylcarbamoyltransferase complex ATPase subunit type 1 TsaE [Patescibacteria group bacterium]|nr:tRNA (adenosine(37)-N6)-threonylcarbamoyltransferase complex ATPase subunit type 1 TsaE [Patescibacteria group bacterium]